MSKVNFKPLGYYILCEAPVIEEKTKSGLIKSDAMVEEEKKSKPLFLKVLAVGDDVKSIEVGDLVLPERGADIELDGVVYLLTQLTSIKGKRIK